MIAEIRKRVPIFVRDDPFGESKRVVSPWGAVVWWRNEGVMVAAWVPRDRDYSHRVGALTINVGRALGFRKPKA